MKSQKIEMLYQQYNEGIISLKMYEFLKYQIVNNNTKSGKIYELFHQHNLGYLSSKEYELLKYRIINDVEADSDLTPPNECYANESNTINSDSTIKDSRITTTAVIS